MKPKHVILAIITAVSMPFIYFAVNSAILTIGITITLLAQLMALSFVAKQLNSINRRKMK